MPRLIALVGATASGKTELALRLAQHFQTEIISADSRQFFRELTIGVAIPNDEQLSAIPHRFIKSRSITEPYSAGRYADDVLTFLDDFFRKRPMALLVGGSGLYVKAVCEGFDDVPPTDPDVRANLNEQLKQLGLAALLKELEAVDPAYYSEVDRSNPRRVLRALEVHRITGRPFSSFRKQSPTPRPFDVMKIGSLLPTHELKERIHERVDRMIEQGLIEEARAMLPYRSLPALQTVGYRELFAYFDGDITFDAAIELIKKNTTQFAKRQMTWWRKDKTIRWFHPSQLHDMMAWIESWPGSSTKPAHEHSR